MNSSVLIFLLTFVGAIISEDVHQFVMTEEHSNTYDEIDSNDLSFISPPLKYVSYIILDY